MLTLLLLFTFTIVLVRRLAVWATYTPREGLFIPGGNWERIEAIPLVFKKGTTHSVFISEHKYAQEKALRYLEDHGVDPNKIYYNCHAIDTLTNFTTLVDEVRAQGITHIKVITSPEHMIRSLAIGTIVFGYYGIKVTGIATEGHSLPESRWRTLRDVMRSAMWGVSGITLASFSPKLSEKQRQEYLEGHCL